MFQEAINYPRESDSAVKNVAIGGILLVLGFLFVPTLFVLGYVVRALRSVLDGDDHPPEFDDWGDLGMDGLKAFAIGLAYSLVPAVLFALAAVAGGATLGLSGGSDAGGAVAGLIAVVAVLATVVVSLLLAYALPAAVVAWVRTDSLSAAFAPSELRPLVFSRTYATGWAVAVGISLLAGVVIGVLNAVLIGAILAPFITFYANVAGAHAIGSAVREMPAVEDGSETTMSQPVA